MDKVICPLNNGGQMCSRFLVEELRAKPSFCGFQFCQSETKLNKWCKGFALWQDVL